MCLFLGRWERRNELLYKWSLSDLLNGLLGGLVCITPAGKTKFCKRERVILCAVFCKLSTLKYGLLSFLEHLEELFTNWFLFFSALQR